MICVHLIKQNEVAWRLMPIALQRIKDFCDEFPVDATAEVLCDKVIKSFTSDGPSVMVFLAIDETRDFRVVGHFLVGLDDWNGVRFLSVMQYRVDCGLDRDVLMAAMLDMERWGRALGCTRWRAITRNRTLARVFRTFYGYEEKGVLVEKAFSPSTVIAAPAGVSPEGTIQQNQEAIQ
jgi:hypothetical protein